MRKSLVVCDFCTREIDLEESYENDWLHVFKSQMGKDRGNAEMDICPTCIGNKPLWEVKEKLKKLFKPWDDTPFD